METGLFISMAEKVYFGSADGSVSIMEKSNLDKWSWYSLVLIRKYSIISSGCLQKRNRSPSFRTHHPYQNVSHVANLYYIHFLNFVYSTPCIVSLCVEKNLMNNSDWAPSFLQFIKIYFLWQRASWGLCRHGKYMIKCVGLTGEGSTKHTANELA